MRVAVLDLETTGRKPHLGTIVEVGICLLNLDNGFITPLLNTTVREYNFEEKFEANRISNVWIFQNSDLQIETVRNGPKWEEFAPKIQKILNKFPVTAYNTAFDFGFLKSRGIKIPQPLPCPMVAATPYLKLPGTIYEYKYPSFQEIWNHFYPQKKDYIETHRACDDAQHEAEIVYELFKRKIWVPI